MVLELYDVLKHLYKIDRIIYTENVRFIERFSTLLVSNFVFILTHLSGFFWLNLVQRDHEKRFHFLKFPLNQSHLTRVYCFYFDIFNTIYSPPPDSQTLEQHQADEQIDVKLLKLMRFEILPNSSNLPKEFVDTLMKLLNRGSIHSTSSSMFDSKYFFSTSTYS